MLYLLMELSLSGYKSAFLVLLSVVAILFGIYVVISKNPIVSVLFLIGLFVGIASYLMFSGTTFIGLAYLLVYVGAVSILFLFILMLINVRISELKIESLNSIPLAMLLGYFFSFFVEDVLPNTKNNIWNILSSSFGEKSVLNEENTDEEAQVSMSDKSNYLGISLENNAVSNDWAGYLVEMVQITGLGNVLYGIYSIWLVVTSIILLLAMVGSIVITIKSPSSRSTIASLALIGIQEDISLFGSCNLFDSQLYDNVIYTYLPNIFITLSLLTLCSLIVLTFIILFGWLSDLNNRDSFILYFDPINTNKCVLFIYSISFLLFLLAPLGNISEWDSLCFFSRDIPAEPSGSDPGAGGGSSSGSGDPNGTGNGRPSGSSSNSQSSGSSNGEGSSSGPNYSNGNSNGEGSSSGPNYSNGTGSSSTYVDSVNRALEAENQARIANCLHPHWDPHAPGRGDLCDFGEHRGNEHYAIQNAEGRAQLCPRCNAVICTQCRPI